MSKNSLQVFDKTIQETNHWLKVLMEELQTDNRRLAFSVLRAVLHTLRDRIGLENAVHFGAQLPMLLRGAYYENWHPANTPTHERHYGEFLDHIDAYLPESSPVAVQDAAKATFAMLAQTIDPAEFEKVLQLLPAEIRIFLPDRKSASSFIPL
jgi:uncharacterized protein (DUF2267 family)